MSSANGELKLSMLVAVMEAWYLVSDLFESDMSH